MAHLHHKLLSVSSSKIDRNGTDWNRTCSQNNFDKLNFERSLYHGVSTRMLTFDEFICDGYNIFFHKRGLVICGARWQCSFDF